MNAKDVKRIIETFTKQITVKHQLLNKLMKSSRMNYLQDELIMQRIEEIENEQLTMIEAFKTLELLDISIRDNIIIRKRAQGKSLQSIGDLFAITSARVRQILNELYGQIADNME